MPNPLFKSVVQHLQLIFAGSTIDTDKLATQIIHNMRLESNVQEAASHRNLWSERDAFLITYADSIIAEPSSKTAKPLHILREFLDTHTEQTINSVHILPFYPYTSDDGFAVSDYCTVREDLGDWQDIQALSNQYRVMADLVINHCSSEHAWFKNFQLGRQPGRDYFFTASPDTDMSQVVRPRTNPLLRPTTTPDGLAHVWCTFSHDQVDLDFRNPQVLIEFVDIIRLYLDSGVTTFRLDAVAFLWKQAGSSCINLEQTHEMVRLLRLLIEHACAEAIIITETNIPNRENLAYFGNANEAHCIYNFSLPPLLLYTLISGNSHYLKLWMMSMPPAQDGTAYFNFIASHDGIGLRPTEGLLAEDEIDAMIKLMESFGGQVSYRALESGESKPYEINISLRDALQGTLEGADAHGVDRFVCAYTIMLALEGIPAIYIHSLLGTHNDYARREKTASNRALNRHQWNYQALLEKLADPNSDHAIVFKQLKALLKIRTAQAAFHPNATQFTLHLGEHIFGFWRQCKNRKQSIFSISNIANRACELPLASVNLIGTDQWRDLISGERYAEDKKNIQLAAYQTVWISNL